MAYRRALQSPRTRALQKKRVVRILIAFVVAAVSVGTAVVLFFDSSFVRISYVSADGGDQMIDSKVQSIAYESISGDYMWLIPKDSFFFFPSQTLSRTIPAEFPEIASVSIARHGFSSVTAVVTERTPAEIACLGSDDADCYYADENGVIFGTASTTEGALLVYHISLPAQADPLGLQFIDAGRLSALAAFVGGLARLGFADEQITVSTSTNYDLSLRYEGGDLSSSAISSSTLHLVIDESRPFSETLQDFSAFWQEYEKSATTAPPTLTEVDMRYGDNIIYKTQ